MKERELKIEQAWNGVTRDDKSKLDEFYQDSIIFKDPIKEIKGLPALKKYYDAVYRNVTSIHFKFTGFVHEQNKTVAFWNMTYAAKGLNGGKDITVEGSSLMEFDPKTQKAFYHRDYFDMGQMVYEKVPLLSQIISWIKNRLEEKS